MKHCIRAVTASGENHLLTIAEAAGQLGVPVQTLRRNVNAVYTLCTWAR